MSAETKRVLANAIVTLLVGLVAQGALYAVTVREDIHELQRDVSELRCQVSVMTQQITLPAGCFPYHAQVVKP